MDFFKKFYDIGDFIGIEGSCFFTKTNELSIEAVDIEMLTKSLNTLPEKWHGLSNVETRYRQRYIDLIANDDVKKIDKIRSEVGMVFQSFNLFPHLSALENCTLAPVWVRKMSKKV